MIWDREKEMMGSVRPGRRVRGEEVRIHETSVRKSVCGTEEAGGQKGVSESSPRGKGAGSDRVRARLGSLAWKEVSRLWVGSSFGWRAKQPGSRRLWAMAWVS